MRSDREGAPRIQSACSRVVTSGAFHGELEAGFPGLEALTQFVEVAFLDVETDAFVVLRLADHDVEDAFEPVADHMGGWAKPDVDPWGMNQVGYLGMRAQYINVDAHAVDELAARPEGVCVAEERFAAYGSCSVGAECQVCSHRLARLKLNCWSSEINLLHRAAKTDREALVQSLFVQYPAQICSVRHEQGDSVGILSIRVEVQGAERRTVAVGS